MAQTGRKDAGNEASMENRDIILPLWPQHEHVILLLHDQESFCCTIAKNLPTDKVMVPIIHTPIIGTMEI